MNSNAGAPANIDELQQGAGAGREYLDSYVLGKRVRSMLEKYEDSVEFYAPDLCFEQTRVHLPAILEGRGVDPHYGLAVLNDIGLLVQPVDRELMSARDIEDWPVVAAAILLGLPIWTRFLRERRRHLDNRPRRIVSSESVKQSRPFYP